MATVGDWIGLVVFLIISGGMGYAAYIVPKILNPQQSSKLDPSDAQAAQDSSRPKISRTSSGIKIANLKQMDADAASYSMVKGGRDMAKKIKQTNAVSFGRRPSDTPSATPSAGPNSTLKVPSPQL